MKKLEAELSALTARAALLTAKRVTAQGAFDSAVAARDAHMLEGNLDDEKISTKLQAAVDSTASALAGFDNALSVQAALIADAEEKLAAERMALDRKAASEDLGARTDAIERQLGPWLAATRELAAGTTAAGNVSFEIDQIGAYLRNAAGEVEMAMAMAINGLRASAAAILAGHQPIPRAPREGSPAAVKVTTPQSVKIFLLKPVKFVDTATNGLRTWPAFHELNLPAELATRALALKAAVPIDHETAKRSLAKGGGQTFEWPDPDRCVSLDGEEKSSDQSPYQPIMHSAFQVVDRGPAFVIKTAPGNASPEAA